MKDKTPMVQFDCAPGVCPASFDMTTKVDGKPEIIRVRGGCGKYFVPKKHVKKFESLTHIKKLFTSGRITRSGGDLNSGGAAKAKAPAASLEKTTPPTTSSTASSGSSGGSESGKN